MRQYLKIWNETTYGVFSSSSAQKNVTYVVVQMDQNNSFVMRPVPQRWEVRSFHGDNRRLQTGSSKFALTGQLQTLLYPEQADFFTKWGLVLTGTPPNVRSCTIDHAIVMEDSSNTVHYRRYLGCKVAQWHLTGSADQQLFRLNIDVMGQKPAIPNITIADFPEPASSEMPGPQPYVFQHMQDPGFMKLNANRAEFNNFDFTVKNILDGTFNESQYITRCKWCGRDVDWTTKLIYISATDRANFEAVTPQTCEARIDNGTKHVIFNFQTAAFPSGLTDDLPLDKVFYQELQRGSYYDLTTSTDLTVTVT